MWIDSIEPDAAEGELAEGYQRVRNADGSVDNVMRMHALNPTTLRTHFDMYKAALHDPSPLSRAEREMVAVVVSRLNGCQYCLRHHAAGLTGLLPDDRRRVVDQLSTGRLASLSDREAAITGFATKLTANPHGMQEPDVQRLRAAGLDDRAILDLCQVVSYFNYVNRMVQGLGVQVEGGAFTIGQGPVEGSGVLTMRSFRSDNNAGLCPEALAALVEANDGAHRVGYGDDEYTAAAVAAFRDLFGDDIEVRFVATGTAANVLAIAALSEPWQQVVCHHHSHYYDDESTAPERITHCRAVPCATDPSRIVPADLARVSANARGDVHEPQPGVVTISNATEFGTLYTPDMVGELSAAAHAAGYALHMDGARFANAAAALGCAPRELTRDAGVDALSFGGTKNGLAFGEAVVFFPQTDGARFARARATFDFHRKGTGHLLSKHRFVSAPFAATLRDGIWLEHARRANAMAARLAAGLRELDIEPAFPVEANGIFVALPAAVDAALQARGHGYYPFGDAEAGLVRLMCSFDTTAAEVDALLADAAGALR